MRGRTTVGDFTETFFAPLGVWSRPDYERQWMEAARLLLEGADRTGFFTEALWHTIVAKFVSAWEAADLDALVALLTDDVFISMPPMPFEYEGRDAVARFCAALFHAGRRFDLMPTRANAQPAFGAYLRAAGDIRHGIGLFVLTLSGDRICAMTRFESTALESFGLPQWQPIR